MSAVALPTQWHAEDTMPASQDHFAVLEYRARFDTILKLINR
jgi:hypothetical protein